MSSSVTQQANLTCPNCRLSFNTHIWIIIDAQKQPDLVAELQAGIIHKLACPKCHYMSQIDAPVLIYRLNDKYPLLFSPAQHTSEEEDERQLINLVKALRNQVGLEWQDDWLDEELPSLPRRLLPAALRDNSHISSLMLEDDNSLIQIESILRQLLEPPRSSLDMPHRIDLCRQALKLISKEQHEQLWATVQVEIGNSLAQTRQGDQADNIEQAIAAFEDALKVFSRVAVPDQWANTMLNLATAYLGRIRGRRADNIEKTITLLQEAIQSMPQTEMAVERAQAMNNLANAYVDRIHGNQAENIERAIAAYHEALQVTNPTSMPMEWAQTMNNLATSYRIRILGDREKNIEQAIIAYQKAHEVMTRATFPIQWAAIMMNLANAYVDRGFGNRAENIQKAVAAYREALSVQKVDLHPSDYQKTQRNLGNLFFAERKWADAQAAYQSAIQAGVYLLDSAYTEYGRQSEVNQTSQLYAHSAYCLYRLGQPRNALQQLEHGKSRLLSQALALGEADLAQLPAAKQTVIQALRRTIRELEGEMRLPVDTVAGRSDRELAELLRQDRVELSQQVAAVRAEFPNFMPNGLDVPEILELIPKDGALIAPCITSQGSFVLVIPHGAGEITAEHIVSLTDLTTGTVQAWLRGSDTGVLGGWLGDYDQFRQDNAPDAAQNWFAAINQVCHALWETLMGSVHQQLQALKLAPGAPVLLMPQGGLGLLPLHAAWREVDGQPRCFSDDYTVAYAPSGYALRVSQRRATQPERQARSLFAAINPTSDLPYTPLEGETIASLFPSEAQTILQEKAATTTAFPTAANGRAYLHYSGHGYYHWGDPLQSGLRLADKAYTLADILRQLDLSGCRLVTLSACETGITEFQQAPDEYVGLPAGFLQAGAPAVISTLWAVNDLSTMLLMERFYQLHLQEGLDFAPALRQAQLWLRDVTARELAERFGEERMKLKGNRLTLAEAGDYWRRFAAMEPESQPFSHPYYWAAFTFTGA